MRYSSKLHHLRTVRDKIVTLDEIISWQAEEQSGARENGTQKA